LSQVDFSQLTLDNGAPKIAFRIAHNLERLIEIPRRRCVMMLLGSKQT
jgi:hypothetical protein